MSNLIKFDPFEEMRSLQSQFFGDNMFSNSMKLSNVPTTDVFTEGDNTLIVEAHLPNYAEDDIQINVDKNILTISAERHEKEEDKDKKYMIRESSSSFYRSIKLPERANDDDIEASVEDGVLKIRVPLHELPEPKKIAVKTGKKAK